MFYLHIQMCFPSKKILIYKWDWTSGHTGTTNSLHQPISDLTQHMNEWNEAWPQHLGLHALLFMNIVWVLLRPPWVVWTAKGCETGPMVYNPCPRRLESWTICGCNYRGSNFSSVILWPWVLVQTETNSQPTEWQPNAQPTEQMVRVYDLLVTKLIRVIRVNCFSIKKDAESTPTGNKFNGMLYFASLPTSKTRLLYSYLLVDKRNRKNLNFFAEVLCSILPYLLKRDNIIMALCKLFSY